MSFYKYKKYKIKIMKKQIKLLIEKLFSEMKFNKLLEYNFDDFDPGHYNNNTFLRNRIRNHYMNLGCKATTLSATSREGNNTLVEIKIRRNTNPAYNTDFIKLKVVSRKSTSKDNFCLKIEENGLNLFKETEGVSHVAFVFDDDDYADKHEIFVLPIQLIKETYDNLMLNKNMKKDENKNFIWRKRLCLTNKFIKNNSIDSFMLNAKEL